MPAAARITDISTHGGTITGPGCPTVQISGMPACVTGDMHVCSLPPNSHQPTTSPFALGSTTVLIGGKPAIRVGDNCVCGASPAMGEPTVMIG